MRNKKRIIINGIIIILILAAAILTCAGKEVYAWMERPSPIYIPEDGSLIDWKTGSFEFTGLEALRDNRNISLIGSLFPFVCIILCLTSMLSKRKGKDPVFHVVFSIISFLAWIYFDYICAYKSEWDKQVEIAFGKVNQHYTGASIQQMISNDGLGYHASKSLEICWTIAGLLLVLCIVLNIVKRSSVITGTEATYKEVGIKSNTIVMESSPVSNADELKKYKDLLDSGVISQEEFDSKKKQILGL